MPAFVSSLLCEDLCAGRSAPLFQMTSIHKDLSPVRSSMCYALNPAQITGPNPAARRWNWQLELKQNNSELEVSDQSTLHFHECGNLGHVVPWPQ